jgi:hypothetical protein
MEFEYQSHQLWVWSLEMVLRCGGKYIWTGGEEERRGEVGEQTDVPLHYPPFKAWRHDAWGPPGGFQIHWYAIGTLSTCRPKPDDGFWHISIKLGKKMTTYPIQKDDDPLHLQSRRHFTLHSYASNRHNTQWSRSVLPIIVSTLVSYDTYLSLIIFKIIPHPMTLLTAFPLQLIILHLI